MYGILDGIALVDKDFCRFQRITSREMKLGHLNIPCLDRCVPSI